MYLLAVWEGGGKQHDFFKHKITHFKRPTGKKFNINRVYNMHPIVSYFITVATIYYLGEYCDAFPFVMVFTSFLRLFTVQ